MYISKTLESIQEGLLLLKPGGIALLHEKELAAALGDRPMRDFEAWCDGKGFVVRRNLQSYYIAVERLDAP